MDTEPIKKIYLKRVPIRMNDKIKNCSITK